MKTESETEPTFIYEVFFKIYFFYWLQTRNCSCVKSKMKIILIFKKWFFGTALLQNHVLVAENWVREILCGLKCVLSDALNENWNFEVRAHSCARFITTISILKWYQKWPFCDWDFEIWQCEHVSLHRAPDRARIVLKPSRLISSC